MGGANVRSSHNCPWLNYFLLALALAGTRSEKNNTFCCSFIWKHCVWFIFPSELWYANFLFRLRGCVLNRNTRPFLLFASSLCYRQTTRTNKEIKMAQESKRARNKGAGAAYFTQDRSVFYMSKIIILIIESGLQPRNN